MLTGNHRFLGRAVIHLYQGPTLCQPSGEGREVEILSTPRSSQTGEERHKDQRAWEMLR